MRGEWFLHGTELTIFAAMKGYRVGEIAFDVRERSGQSRFGQRLSGNYKIIRAMMISMVATGKLTGLRGAGTTHYSSVCLTPFHWLVRQMGKLPLPGKAR